MFVRKDAYHIVARHSSQVNWLSNGYLHCIHTLDLQPMQKPTTVGSRAKVIGGRLLVYVRLIYKEHSENERCPSIAHSGLKR